MDPKGYCWTHEFLVEVGHNSFTCTNKKEDHKDEATPANIMGGYTQNKNLVHSGMTHEVKTIVIMVYKSTTQIV